MEAINNGNDGHYKFLKQQIGNLEKIELFMLKWGNTGSY